MRIAFVTDIHGNLPALDAVVRDFTRRGVTQVVNLGDSLSGPLLPRETADYLMAQDWFHLAGNHERQILSDGPVGQGASDAYARSQLTSDQLAWIAAQKPMAQYRDDIYLCHGSPRSDLEYFLESVDPLGRRAATPAEVEERLDHPRGTLIACGHSHVPRLVRSADGTLIVNPGSVGVQAYDAEHPYPHVVENHSPDARYAIVELVDEQWVASLIAVPYDHESMARLAERNQRPTWARALRTGMASHGH
jgi:predicted phosphodiesterase